MTRAEIGLDTQHEIQISWPWHNHIAWNKLQWNKQLKTYLKQPIVWQMAEVEYLLVVEENWCAVVILRIWPETDEDDGPKWCIPEGIELKLAGIAYNSKLPWEMCFEEQNKSWSYSWVLMMKRTPKWGSNDGGCTGYSSSFNGLCRNCVLAKMQNESESVFVMAAAMSLGLKMQKNGLYVVCFKVVNPNGKLV